MKTQTMVTVIARTLLALATSTFSQLSYPRVEIVPGRAALLNTDSQNEFPSAKGVTSDVVSISGRPHICGNWLWQFILTQEY